MSTIQAIFSGLRFGLTVGSSPAADRNLVNEIVNKRSELSKLDDDALRLAAAKLRHSQDRRPAATPVDAFALIDQVVHRSQGIWFHDVQFLAGLAMLRNDIAELKTGEGKTLVGALVAFAWALHGRGVHLMTTNEYLAQRDHEIAAPIMQRLSFSVGLIQSGMSAAEKAQAYRSDITYGPGYEFGFDYLRDQLALLQKPTLKLGEHIQSQQRGNVRAPVAQMQPARFCAIVDEADSVLIDDAITPLILSSSTDRPNENPQPYQQADAVARRLALGTHYDVDYEKRLVSITLAGQQFLLGQIDSAVRGQLCRPWQRYIEQSLTAQILFNIDAHYVVLDDRVRIVDGNTGRVFADRSWSDGLHQAVEAKEGVTISEENRTLARVTRQQYFRLYDNLCGMTGTAVDARRELSQVYGVKVTVVETAKPCQRIEQPPRFFASDDAKWQAIAQCVRRMHSTGQPVLIGTRTIEKSETIAGRLEGVPYQLLNGKQDADEAQLVAAAGGRGAVTIATNMAGRGTNIKLGEGVEALGGLMVIVSEPHDSARIDRQLIGRTARQGQPGTSQNYVSADDSLIQQHAPWLARHLRGIAGANGEVASDLSSEIVRLQSRVERKSAADRRQMFSREHWLEDALATLVKP